MKTYIDIIAENIVAKETRLLRKMEIDTNKIKAGLTTKQKAIFARIVERLGLKGKELTDAQEGAILFITLYYGDDGECVGPRRLLQWYYRYSLLSIRILLQVKHH